MAVDPLIELHDVNKYYGELHVLQDIDLAVGKGEVVVVIDPSGSGKSTQVRGRKKEEADNRSRRLLGRVGLAGQAPKFPVQLSGGRRLGAPPRPFRRWGRVAGARAGAMEPKVLLSDEPTSGVTMVVVTPEMGFARSAANRAVFMSDGRIIEDRAPEEFFTDPHSERAKDVLPEILKH
ncbi:amino acid ABC transporter ATP-binding protein [Streptomyces sp. NPDC051172]|uniref:amino acid ABC transporter ATP-binding protein n=1 Tax=Streptomyces sp. NPDC051172 TaxID=3155796 RepID=UPI00341888A2